MTKTSDPEIKSEVTMSTNVDTLGKEAREESSGSRDVIVKEERETVSAATSKEQKSKAGSSKSRSSNSGAGNNKKGGRNGYGQNHMMMNGRGHYNPMMLSGGGPPYAPPPYGYMGSSYGPPPPFHPPPHMGMAPYGGAPFHGHMGGPMKGPNYPPHPHHGHYHGPPYGMPPTYPHHSIAVNNSYANASTSSDSGSITSKGSMNSKKKRTIDGVHGNLPNAYAFRRTDSNSSNASTLTTGNNTSMETANTEDTLKDKGSDVAELNMDGMVFEDRLNPNQSNAHRRSNSVASTASSLSVCGFSLESYEGQRGDDNSKTSSKRQKKSDLVVDTSVRPSSRMSNSDEQNSRFEQMSIENKGPLSGTSATSSNSGRNVFLTLSTSPINTTSGDVDATPLKANTTNRDSGIFRKCGKVKDKEMDDAHRPSETPTPPAHGELGVTEASDDHSTLNRHLRGQSFTPLPHIASADNTNTSPTNNAFASSIVPQLSWSIAGDTPSLGELADWDEDNTKLKSETQVRPDSTSSSGSNHEVQTSPNATDFHPWKEEQQEMSENDESGTATPLPVFFEQSGNEGNGRSDAMSRKMSGQYGEPHAGFVGSSSNQKHMRPEHPGMWGRHDPGMGPGPMYGGDYRDDGFGMRSPHHGDRRDNLDFYPTYPHMHGPNDRIRNLRGRVHPGAHLPPMPIHIPPPLSAHLPMTSPMGLGGGKSLWSPHHAGMPGALGSPHHLGSPLANMAQSKRKCVPLKPPIPSKFQGDIEKTKSVPVPEFTSLVNFPTHMSQKQAVNLPDGMRCCVMCGQACPCSSSHKGKKNKNKATNNAPPQRSDHLGDKSSGYAIIPTQNKGLCTLCDVNVWVVVSNGLEIKWCKGCKNFRPWAAFGDKGLATKCLRCRERQREKYALQKEEKEKARAAVLVKQES